MAVTELNEAPEPKWRQWLQPWKIAVALVALFLLVQTVLSWKDQDLITALDLSPAFAEPEFPLEFSRKIQYDPLTFVGRGARAGFWDWTPEGLVLATSGREYFHIEGDRIVSNTTAGRRRFSRFQARATQGSGERITFFYRWEEISPPAVALLFPPPELGNEYLATAVVNRVGEGWELVSLEAPDYEEPLEHLQAVASGILQ